MIDGDVFKTIAELNTRGPEWESAKIAIRTGLLNMAEEYLEKKIK